MSILSEIVSAKRLEVSGAKSKVSVSHLRERIGMLSPPRDFSGAVQSGRPSIIAEIKKASPSKGVMVEDFDHRAIARDFEEGGAAALSVLTDREFFHGRPDYVADVRKVAQIPILRKDFIIDEYQVIESRVLEADAILLIVRILEPRRLSDLMAAASSLNLAALVEVHNEEDLSKAMDAGATLIGINSRDLSDFSVSLDRAIALREMVPGGVVTVAESGIQNARDAARLVKAGFQALLVGEKLIRSSDRVQSLRELTGT